MSLSIWEMLGAIFVAVVAFFVPFGPHNPNSRAARIAVIGIPLLLFVADRYLWANSGKGLLERGTCIFAPLSYSCQQHGQPDERPVLSTSGSAPKGGPSPTNVDASSTTAPRPDAAGDTNRSAPPAQSHTTIIPLSGNNAKMIWSTSVYSYAPGGGGPGGGLANDRLRVGGWGDEYVSLIEFDLPNVPCTSKVELQLYNSSDSDSPTPMRLEIITTDWSWKDGDRLWWRNLPQTTPYSTSILTAPQTNAWASIDISEIFRSWCTKALPNYGIMLRPVLNNNNYDAFYSSRFSDDVSLRPRLVVTN